MFVLYKMLIFILKYTHISKYNTYVKYVHGALKCFGSKTRTTLRKSELLRILKLYRYCI